MIRFLTPISGALFAVLASQTVSALEIAGISVIPHSIESRMRYSRPRDTNLAARVQLFLRNDGDVAVTIADSDEPRFDARLPAELVASGDWAWHDTPSARTNSQITLAPGSLTVWSFNGRSSAWGLGRSATVEEAAGGKARKHSFTIEAPTVWLSAVTFLNGNASATPDRMVVHIANDDSVAWRVSGLRLWLPTSNASFRALLPGKMQTSGRPFAADGWIPSRDKGGIVIPTGPLPLTYAAVEVVVADRTGRERRLWSHQRIKRETFDISGGWISGKVGDREALTLEPYLKLLGRLHVNTGQHQHIPGYSDTPLYDKYPLKYFNRMAELGSYDTEAVLPRVHAVEFLGEPQFGGGKPVPPQDVFNAFLPYAASRLPTSVTHSEERIWRNYAGLSDYPHYDAYRVVAPAADSWRLYDRWGGQKISWGAPLETIGDMTRSLRELNRPAPIAYWSQGVHSGWSGGWSGRKRGSPTPDELRVQAWHGLAARITSLYWFNLSHKSLMKFPDAWDDIARVGREIRLLEDLFLKGDAYRHTEVLKSGKPDWELSSIAAPESALLVAMDCAYAPDPEEKVFRFGPPREARFRFALPIHLQNPKAVVRIDADGVQPVAFKSIADGVEISDKSSKVAIYVATRDASLGAVLGAKLATLIAAEAAFGFDPIRVPADMETLKNLAAP